MSHIKQMIACTGIVCLLTSPIFIYASTEINSNNTDVSTVTDIDDNMNDDIDGSVYVDISENSIDMHQNQNMQNDINHKINNGVMKETYKDVDREIDRETKESYVSKNVPSDNSFKSYMFHKSITNKSSEQYRLQQCAYTGEYGIRMVDGRYMIALGSYYSPFVGIKVDILMNNGSVLKCVTGDLKANQHTCSKNMKAHDGSIVEFIVDKEHLHPIARKMGDMSYVDNSFSGEIKEIRVYKE